MSVTVAIARLPHSNDIALPSYATIDSAGCDLCAAITDDILLKPFERALVPTGFAIALPVGYEAQVRPRSGFAVKHGITVLNSPGTIDSDYRGEIKVILVNLSYEPFTISRGMRIAQMVVAPVNQVTWEESAHLNITSRGGGGFGSTGT